MVKNPPCQCRRCKRLRFDPWVKKIPWRRAWQSTPAFLPGESQGQRSLACYSSWGCKELDTNEAPEHARMHKSLHSRATPEKHLVPFCWTQALQIPYKAEKMISWTQMLLKSGARGPFITYRLRVLGMSKLDSGILGIL